MKAKSKHENASNIDEVNTAFKNFLENNYNINYDYDVWTKDIENRPLSYADKNGLIKCGTVHRQGFEENRQPCCLGCSHRINPYRTYIERRLLSLFELDHE